VDGAVQLPEPLAVEPALEVRRGELRLDSEPDDLLGGLARIRERTFLDLLMQNAREHDAQHRDEHEADDAEVPEQAEIPPSRGHVAFIGAGSGPLGGWAVGGTPRFLPEGQALPIARNSDIVLQMHFHPVGKAEREQSTIGIYFAKTPPERRMMNLQLPGLFGVGAGIDIPAGDKSYAIESSATLPVDVKVFAANPHAHYLAKEMKATATLPDGTTRPLLWIQNWDFNWQDGYNYKEPVLLPKGSRIDVRISWDNVAIAASMSRRDDACSSGPARESGTSAASSSALTGRRRRSSSRHVRYTMR